MFILRSVFWLGLAMIVLLPREWDWGSEMHDVGREVLNSGQAALTQQVNSMECTNIECAGGKALLLASGMTDNPLLASPMQDSKAQFQAPVPRPRLRRAG